MPKTAFVETEFLVLVQAAVLVMEEMRNGLHQHQDAPEAEAATELDLAAEEEEPGAKQDVATADSDLEPVPKRARTAAARRMDGVEAARACGLARGLRGL